MEELKSILGDQDTCYICNRSGYLEEHHVFNASNKKHSDTYGLTVMLCHDCHRGTNGIHGKNGHELNLKLKVQFQRIFEKLHSHEVFMSIFRKSYL